MPPRFSLQAVLDYRHSRVEALELEFSRLLIEEQQRRSELEEVQGVHAQLQSALAREQSGDINLFTVSQLRGNIEGIRLALPRLQAALETVVEQIQDKRAELVAARQAEETLSILKDKEQAQYTARQASEENRMIDDIYISQGYQAGSGKTPGMMQPLHRRLQ